MYTKKYIQSLISEAFEETLEATGTGSAGGFEAPLFGDMKEDELEGGNSDKKTLEDIIKKHSKKFKNLELVKKEIGKQLKKGIDVEREHTKKMSVAREIALDHLYENPYYYDELEKIEGEFTEATSSSSSGSYETASFLAKDLKNWGPSKRTQIPGGQFVSVKEKCKTFPYCNQGIGALEFSNSKTKAIKNLTKRKPKKKRPLDEAIYNVSLKTGLSEQEIKNIILSVINR